MWWVKKCVTVSANWRESVAENCYPLHVCERLHVPMARKRAGALPRAM
jgi:hypothetical protein